MRIQNQTTGEWFDRYSTEGPLQQAELAGQWGVWDHEDAEYVGTFDNYSDARDLQMELMG